MKHHHRTRHDSSARVRDDKGRARENSEFYDPDPMEGHSTRIRASFESSHGRYLRLPPEIFSIQKLKLDRFQ